MSKEEVLKGFDEIFENPYFIKEGNLFHEKILAQAEIIIEKDRKGLIEVLHDWLTSREVARTSLTLDVAEQLVIKELLPDITALRKDIEDGKIFQPYYIRRVDEVISKIR